MDRDWTRKNFERLGSAPDPEIPGLFIEWWVGPYPGRDGQWLCRRLVVSPGLQAEWVLRTMAGDMELDRAIQERAESLDQTTYGGVPQHGRHQWTRTIDGARIIRQPYMSLN